MLDGGSGSDCSGSGGYSGGCDSTGSATLPGYTGDGGINGLGYAGGGYYTGTLHTLYNLNNYLGGMGIVGRGSSGTVSHNSGNGGTGGSGGTINVSSIATVYAYNGNIYTDGTSYDNGENQAYIYAQNGIINERIVLPVGYGYVLYGDITYISASTIATLDDWNSGLATKTYILDEENNIEFTFDMSTQGVGSGAGYIELSNGTYTIDSSMN